ncbi:MAG: tRNA epoxyqueuosine(34) reductase QueG [Ignavibacteria bacterium]|nr:tRNA epoxyqueuosine(34) reductase QueG [Ignavibacteria bacterium]MCC7158265.1 tRNA epoxyqueuosine(34) reductase QueG [Ignavibacteria bacterium]
MNLTSIHLKKIIQDKATELGFIKTGFAKYSMLENESGKLRTWLDDGKQADMAWIERGFDKRKDVRLIMPEAKGVISLAFNYYTPFEHDETKPKISRYAWGKDYHKILKKKLKELCEFIEKIPLNPPFYQRGEERSDGGFKTRAYVDDGPVMDKAWAVRAGIGWMGKHTNVINPEFGSWFFISEIITNIEFDSYDEPIEDLCGSCSLCISACPTGAITDEYVVDANKCISYQTIENRGEIPPEINLDGWIFGCDECQDVCPFNSPKYNFVTVEGGFYPLQLTSPPTPLLEGEGGKEFGISTPSGYEGCTSTTLSATSSELESLTEEKFNEIFADSPIKRTKFKGWKRNLANISI